MCNCVHEINEQLKDSGHNTKVAVGTAIHRETMDIKSIIFVQTAKIDSKNRKKALDIQCSFCPFCGTKWGEEKESEAA